MLARYTIEADPAHQLIRLVLRGFFTPAEVAAFKVEKAAALATLNCAPNRHLTLVDVSECKIQSQDVFAAFAAQILDPQSMSRRFAIVVGSSLARMQVRRVLTRPEAACFDDLATAEAWLLGEASSPGMAA